MDDDLFPTVIQLVYETSSSVDRDLRNILVEIFAKYADILVDNDPLFDALTEKVGQFWADVVLFLIRNGYRYPVLESAWLQKEYEGLFELFN